MLNRMLSLLLALVLLCAPAAFAEDESAALAMDEYDMIILDELVTAVEIGAVDRALAEQLFCNAPYEAELVLTGHSAPQWMTQKADYITEMKCVKHPYQSGLPAREGIEY